MTKTISLHQGLHEYTIDDHDDIVVNSTHEHRKEKSYISTKSVIFLVLFANAMDSKLFVLVQIIIIIILTFSSNGICTFPSLQNDAYMTVYDKVDVDEILENKKLLRNYFKCLMKKGPCSPDGREIRRAIPEVLQTACAKCTKTQKDSAIKIINFLRKNEQEKYQKLANKYDPTGIYRKQYLQSSRIQNSI